VTRIPPGSLKCVVLASPAEISRARSILEGRVRQEDIRPFGAGLLLQTTESAEMLRDWLKELGAVMVVEFEVWSGYGEEVPREWLLARGH
jgi:hypothetical protein